MLGPIYMFLKLIVLLFGMIWARATAFYDDPNKVGNPDSRHLGRAVNATLESATSELLMESAYFVPLTSGVNTLAMTGETLFTRCGLVRTRYAATMGAAERPKIPIYLK